MEIASKEIQTVLKILKRAFPNPGAMQLENPYRTLVGVILSARTRDEQVLKLLPGFFAAFPTPQTLADANVLAIRAKISTIGMFRQKAKNLKKMAEVLVTRFGGEVPRTMDELLSLAGVGRKTASVLLVACFDTAAIAVDTHVHRVTNRLGWVKTSTPTKTEQALLALVPPRLHSVVNSVFVKFGRYVCMPGRPRCWMCPISDFCAFKNKNFLAPKDAEAVMGDIARREAALEASRQACL